MPLYGDRKIQTHGVARSRVLRDAHAALHQPQNFFTAEVIRGPRANVIARANFHPAAARLAQRFHLLAKEAVQFGVRVAGEQPFARRGLHGVGQGLVELFENGLRRHLPPGELPLKLRGQPQEQILIHSGMQAPQAREVRGLVKPALPHAPSRWIE